MTSIFHRGIASTRQDEGAEESPGPVQADDKYPQRIARRLSNFLDFSALVGLQ